MTARSTRLLIAALGLTLVGPALQAGPDRPAGRLIRRDGRPLERRELMQAAAAAELVFMGEEHGNAAHHRLQRDLLAAMADEGPAALGCEYFPRSLQPVLDRFNRGEISFKDLPEALDWKRTWGHPWKAYAPLFKLCAERRIPVFALNAEKATARAVARKGFMKGLDRAGLLGLPEIMDDNEAYRARVRERLTSVHPMPEAMLQNYYEAFLLWDETMADSVCRILLRDRRPELKILVVAGQAHIETGTGIPDRVARRLNRSRPRLIVVGNSSSKPKTELGDVLFHTPKPRKPKLY